MATVYRSIFQAEHPRGRHWPVLAVRIFSQWLEQKRRAAQRHGQELPAWSAVPDEPGEIQESGWTLRRAGGQSDDVEALRLTLVEPDAAGERWTSEVTTWTRSGSAWVWIELSRATDGSDERPALLSIFDLSRRFLEQSTCLEAGWPLTTGPREIPPAEVASLADHLFDPARTLPLVLVTQGRKDLRWGTVARAMALNRVVRGVAKVVVLHEEAQASFEERVGSELTVMDGAIRTYLPGIDPVNPHSARHESVRWLDVKEWDEDGMERWALPLIRQATALQPPAEYGQKVLPLLAMPTDEGTAEALLEELVAAESLIEHLSEELATCRAANRVLLDERDALVQQLNSLEGSNAATNALTTEALSSAETESTQAPPATCEDAARDSRHLEFVVVPQDVAQTASKLDSAIQRKVWAGRIHHSLRELDRYAAAKHRPNGDRFQGDFGHWLANLGGAGIAFARSESDTVRNNGRLRRQREFPVPTEVNPRGRVEMQSHIRIGSGKPPAPRLYFHDDTAGVSGKIIVGYIGPHLPTMRTN